ncbi:MAG: hypothetical protein IKX96_01255 [Firmicutes bacterium]|nr:hypothetical protein [Bacillota bacterium]
MAKVFELDDSNFTKEVKLSEKPIVLVEFYAEWQEESLAENVLPELSDEFDYVKVCRTDVDKAQKMAARYGVIKVPTYMVFRQGQIIGIQPGVQTKENLANMIM